MSPAVVLDFPTAFGAVRVTCGPSERLLAGIGFVPGSTGSPPGSGRRLADTLRALRLPPARTPFLAAVRSAAQAIPPGKTVTYAELAARAGHPGAARAVGQAMARNPFALLVPCHRVVPASGGQGGYRWGTGRKRRLLEWERESRREAWEMPWTGLSNGFRV